MAGSCEGAGVFAADTQILPVNTRISKITTTRPRPPLGPYPQLLLCGHEGKAPINSRMSTMSRIVPIDIIFFR
jgi:hypothetical protein